MRMSLPPSPARGPDNTQRIYAKYESETDDDQRYAKKEQTICIRHFFISHVHSYGSFLPCNKLVNASPYLGITKFLISLQRIQNRACLASSRSTHRTGESEPDAPVSELCRLRQPALR